MPSPAQTLELQVRIPLETWMSDSMATVFVSCRETGLISRPRSPTDSAQDP
jgi:hypothetical protein